MGAIHLFRPVVSENAISAVAEALRSGWTGLGPKVATFEKNFAAYVGAKYCVALNSCTSALHLALHLLNLEEGDEVISTALSILGIEPILYTNNGIVQMSTMEEFANKYFNEEEKVQDRVVKTIKNNGIQVMCVDKDSFKVLWKPIQQIVKHPTTEDVYDIKLAHGRHISVTKYHNVFLYTKEGIKAVPSNELRLGDYVVVPKRFTLPSGNVEEINVLEHLLSLSGYDIENIYCYNVPKEIFETSINWKFKTADKHCRRLPLKILQQYRELCRALQQLNKESEIVLATASGQKWSLCLKIDANWNRMLGYYCAEGCISTNSKGGRNQVRFTFGLHEKETFAQEVEFILKQYNINYQTRENTLTNSYVIEINNKVFVGILKSLGCGTESHSKRVPSCVWNGTPEMRRSFLQGYWRGDGNIYTNKLNGTTVSFFSVNQVLINDIIYLLLSFNIPATFLKYTPDKERTFFIEKTQQSVQASEGFVAKITHRDLVEKVLLLLDINEELPIIQNRTESWDKLLPRQLLPFAVWRTDSKQERVGLTTLRTHVSAGNKELAEQFIQRFEDGDIALLPIEEISVLPGENQKVYDVSVPDIENFIAGTGGVLVHNTFVSTNHAILYVGATPVFADVQLDTGCIDPDDIESKITEKTKAIMVVHFGGYPADMDEIHTIARTYGIQVIEDAAHACGSAYRGQMIGSVSAINCFSFQAVKNLSLGDGGCITTNNKFYFDKLNKLRWLGIDKSTYARTETSGSTLNAKAYSWLYDVPLVGHKMHMNDINAAIGIEQLKLLDQENARRAEIAEMYREGLKDVAGIKFMQRQADRKSSNHIFAIRADKRDYLMDKLKQNDIHCGVHYRLNTRYPMYPKTSLPNAEKLESELISLPLHLALTDEDIQRVIDIIRRGW